MFAYQPTRHRKKQIKEKKEDTPRDLAVREAIRAHIEIEDALANVVRSGDLQMLEQFIVETKQNANLLQVGYLKVLCFRSYYLYVDMKLEIDGRADGSRKQDKGFFGLNKGITQVKLAHYDSSEMPLYNLSDKDTIYFEFTDDARRLVQDGSESLKLFTEAETIKKISQTSDENLAKFSEELYPKARIYYMIKDVVPPSPLYRGLRDELGFRDFL